MRSLKKIKIYLMTNKELWARAFTTLIPLCPSPKTEKEI